MRDSQKILVCQNDDLDPYPRTWAEVDLGALAHNLGLIRKIVGPETSICLVAKADAYGHGLVPVSRFAVRAGATHLAVATVSEGIALRDAGIDVPILILSPILPVEATQAVFYGLDVVLENLELATALSQAAQSIGRKSRCHLKVDTGLSRFGCRPSEAVEIAKAVKQLPGVELVGVSQHFIDSRGNEARTNRQIEIFHDTLNQIKGAGIELEYIHAGNSAGAAKHPLEVGNLVRIGMLAYGIDGLEMTGGQARPVMSMFSRIISVRNILPGETVGYLATYEAKEPTRVLTIGAGYGDGVSRHLSNKGVVSVGGVECPMIGLVCMDQLMVDGTHVPNAKIGDTVELLGAKISAGRLAQMSGSNAHEIVTRITPRVPRRFKYPD